MGDIDGFYELPIPDELRVVACRHQQHVAELVAKLRKVGMDDDLIERSVDLLITSYREQLLQAVKELGGLCHVD